MHTYTLKWVSITTQTHSVKSRTIRRVTEAKNCTTRLENTLRKHNYENVQYGNGDMSCSKLMQKTQITKCVSQTMRTSKSTIQKCPPTCGTRNTHVGQIHGLVSRRLSHADITTRRKPLRGNIHNIYLATCDNTLHTQQCNLD